VKISLRVRLFVDITVPWVVLHPIFSLTQLCRFNSSVNRVSAILRVLLGVPMDAGELIFQAIIMYLGLM
jgi:hypothetical protein